MKIINAYTKIKRNIDGQTVLTPDGTIAPESNGFTIGGFTGNYNKANVDFVAWNFRAAPAFFDVQTWTGDGVYRNIPHSLGTEPGMVIVKRTNNGSEWSVWHKSLNFDYQSRLRLNTDGSIQSGEDFWGTTENQTVDFNANTFSVGRTDQVNAIYDEYVAYLFADTPGLIKCGKYTGNEALTGINCGFKPGWVLIKRTDSTPDWIILDNTRGSNVLSPNLSSQEKNESSWNFEFTSTGFKVSSNFNDISSATGNYIYVAIAEDALAGEFVPTGIVTEADVNGPTLTLGDTTGDWTSQVGLPVAGPTNTADGIWDSYDGNEATLSSVNGRWIGANGAGTTFEIAPKDGLVTTVNEAYGKLQIVGDKARVNAIQMDDPGFINVTAQDYTIEFPSVFATGNDPDTDLPEGTSISAIVKAENIIGESIVESNTVMPQLPNPEGAAGPITATTETELTVGASVHLDEFIANDSLVMVDETGAVTSYSPETSAITGVTTTEKIGVWTKSWNSRDTQ